MSSSPIREKLPLTLHTTLFQLKFHRQRISATYRSSEDEVLAVLERESRGVRGAPLLHVRDAGALLPVGDLPRDVQGQRLGAEQRGARADDALWATGQVLFPWGPAGSRSRGSNWTLIFYTLCCFLRIL